MHITLFGLPPMLPELHVFPSAVTSLGSPVRVNLELSRFKVPPGLSFESKSPSHFGLFLRGSRFFQTGIIQFLCIDDAKGPWSSDFAHSLKPGGDVFVRMCFSIAFGWITEVAALFNNMCIDRQYPQAAVESAIF